LTALMVCAAAGLIDSVDRLLGFGADVFLRVPMPYEILQSRTRGSLEFEQKLMGLKHRRIRIGDETYIMVGVNAHDLARLFGHRQVASILAKHMYVIQISRAYEHMYTVKTFQISVDSLLGSIADIL
ncbi:putative ATP-dependent RNA helicase YTHDC2, partial [Fasciola gigantica]